MDLENRALEFATAAHGGQRRKYTGDPYIVHPIAVAEIVRSVAHTPEMIAASLLHDVVEDTQVTLAVIHEEFGNEIARLVAWLTDVSSPYHGNRKRRKELDRLHISIAPPEAMTIRLADIIDNSGSVRKFDPDFWRIYRTEKTLLLDALGNGDLELMSRARSLLDQL